MNYTYKRNIWASTVTKRYWLRSVTIRELLDNMEQVRIASSYREPLPINLFITRIATYGYGEFADSVLQ